MNIIVRTYGGHYIVRPDTTWERDNEDFFPPEFVSAISFTPVVTARICKPGRSIGIKFADRYFDGTGRGILLYPEDLMDGSNEGFACASCLDHTSFIPLPACKKENESPEIVEMIKKAISEATAFIYIRSGDIIAIETSEMERLCTKENGTVTTAINDDTASSFRIIF